MKPNCQLIPSQIKNSRGITLCDDVNKSAEKRIFTSHYLHLAMQLLRREDETARQCELKL
uniref:Uncharacterized protein n=1 Tax=Onchocerca volvulus TaxID=6282 RepID=A0A8R1XYA7_ONCVO